MRGSHRPPVTPLVLALGLGVLTLGVYLLSHQLDQYLTAQLRERADAQLVSVEHGRVLVRDAAGDGALDEQAWVFADGRVARACGGDVTADATATGGHFVLRLPRPA